MPLSGCMFLLEDRGQSISTGDRACCFLTHLLPPVNICNDSKDQVGINSVVQVVMGSSVTSDDSLSA